MQHFSSNRIGVVSALLLCLAGVSASSVLKIPKPAVHPLG